MLILMARYSNEERDPRNSGESYLLHLDKKFGFRPGATYDLCKRAIGDKLIEKKEYRISYKGSIEKMIRVSPRNFQPVKKKIFLIEDGNSNERKVLAQVFLDMEDQSE